ncbi:hypothetical protein NQ317_005174, partial [Molorchus minor]
IVGLALVGYGSLSAYSILLINSEYVIKRYGTLIPSVVLAGFGLILIILMIVGCCGIWRESPCCLESYCALLLLLAFTQIAFGGYCIISYGSETHRINLYYQIDSDIYKAVQNYKYDSQWMDEIQTWLKCCGRKDAMTEYSLYSNLPNTNELPQTCCGTDVPICRKGDHYEDGCSEMVKSFTFGTNFVMGYISAVVGVTEVQNRIT